MFIAVDFDGTIAEHKFPEIGFPAPDAFDWMKKWQAAGAYLVLNTMRSDGQRVGDVLTEAVNFCKTNGIEFCGVNENPDQKSWTTSPKVYAHLYIDDAAFGCPLQMLNGRECVDWSIVGPAVLTMIKEYYANKPV